MSVNGQPASRKGDLIQCSAKIGKGSSDVTIGGLPVSTMVIGSEVPEWLNTVLLGAGIGSAVVLAGPVVALFGLAGSIGGQRMGEWVGEKWLDFEDGSDGHKVTGLVGSMLGGALGAKIGVGGRVKVPAKSIKVGNREVRIGGRRPIDLRPATRLGNRIGGRAGGFVRGGVRGVVPRAAQQRLDGRLTEAAAAERNPLGPKIAVAQDRTNPAISEVETSGHRPGSPVPARTENPTGPQHVHPELAKQYGLHETSREPWPRIENCAEFKAVNRALWRGAQLENLEVSTIDRQTRHSSHRCDNCQHTLRRTYVPTDDPSSGAPGVILGGSNPKSDTP